MAKVKTERGKWITRSVYQKVCEENKRLKADIYTMVMMPVTGQSILVKGKWKDHFEQEKELANILHAYAVQYIKDNPDSIPAQISRQFPVKGGDQL